MDTDNSKADTDASASPLRSGRPRMPSKKINWDFGRLEDFYTGFKTIADLENPDILLSRARADGRLVIMKKITDLEEIENHQALDQDGGNPHIAKLYGAFWQPTLKGQAFDGAIAVMEYIDGPDLRELTCIKGAIRDEAQLAGLARQALEGLSYMHGLGYAHRDIKPENMVIGSDGTLRIIDYEFATIRQDARPCCTLQYAAPEIAEAKMYKRKYDGKCADMYSLGMSLLSMAIGGYPFQDMLDAIEVEDLTEEQRHRLMSGDVDYGDADLAQLTPGFLLFISSLVKVKPLLRPTAEEALKHWWLSVHDPKLGPQRKRRSVGGDVTAVKEAIQHAYAEARQLLAVQRAGEGGASECLSPEAKQCLSAFVRRSQEEGGSVYASPKTPFAAEGHARHAVIDPACIQETPTAILESDDYTTKAYPRRLSMPSKRSSSESPECSTPVFKIAKRR